MVRYPKDWNERRIKVLRRDRFTCKKCNVRNVRLHVHHIKPLSNYGTNALKNLTTLCEKCHERHHPHMIVNKVIGWMIFIGLVFIVGGYFIGLEISVIGLLFLGFAYLFKRMQIEYFVERKKWRRSNRRRD